MHETFFSVPARNRFLTGIVSSTSQIPCKTIKSVPAYTRSSFSPTQFKMQKCCLLCSLLLALIMLTSIPTNVNGCDYAQSICGAHAPGDVVIGIMLPCHRKVNAVHQRIRPESFHCTDFDLEAFMLSLAAIHEIEKINAAGFLPGVHLGYLMCDTCSYPSKALQNVENMLAVNRSLNAKCDHIDFRPRVKIILGALYSEVSIALARLLNLYMVPLLSSTSSSPELSDKLRYPVFMRTIPSDKHQTRALAKIMHHYGWNWVGVIYEDDEYGRAAFQSFLRDAEANSVCLAYQEVLPYYLDPSSMQRIKQVSQQIRSSNAQVVLLILNAELVKAIFKEMIMTNTSRIWIASDAWSMSRSITQMDGINKVGDILGLTFAAGKSESFDNYLKNLTATPGGYNLFIEEYKNLRFNCSSECFSNKPPSHCPTSNLLKIKSSNACNFTDPQDQNDDYLVKALDTSASLPSKIAVWAVANALKKLLVCNSSACLGETNFPPWKLLKELKKVKFEVDNQKYFFDPHGDFLSGYDLIMWERDGHNRRFQRIGKYHILDEQLSVKNFTWISTANVTTPQSRCTERCTPGSVKKILNVSCCYNCTLCMEGTFSDAWDLDDCKKCPTGTWSLKGWNRCKPRWESYLQWSDPHPIAFMSAAAFGILLLMIVFIIFLVYRHSPPMKRAEVRLSCVMMAGLAVSFASVICFMGKPSVHICRARQLMHAMGFTLCVSCILVKAYRTFLAFLPFGQMKNRRLHKLYKPPVFVIVITTLQGIICLLWLIFDSPDIDDKPPSPQSMKKIIQCSEGTTYIGFGIMLSYIGLLAFVGFLLAFKSRKVPQEFSETGYIIFSMLMYLFVWVCFIPVYITNKEKGAPVQASAILVSSYGIIFCHFLPKCYEALFTKTDTLERILRRWRVISSTNIDSETEIDKDIPGMNTLSQRSGRFSISSTSTILRNSGTLSEVSPTNSELVIMPKSNEKMDVHSPFNRHGTKLTWRRRSISL